MRIVEMSSRRTSSIQRYSRYFPINSINSVIELFRVDIVTSSPVDLAFISIILGAVEHDLAQASNNIDQFPVIEFARVDTLYQQFATLLRRHISASDIAQCRQGSVTVSSREIVRKISDVVWSCLTRSYHKDRAHMQSLYSLLTDNKLDCFGVAVCVVAACQLLTLDDVHLSMSEDHVWVVFGQDQTAQVTWHGKGVEDRRGETIDAGLVARSWLYLNGQTVTCTKHMEAAAIVASLNATISSTEDSQLLNTLQQQLLWLFHDFGHLDLYPVAVSNLADAEELSPTPGRPAPLVLYHKAIESVRQHYNNMHVYPYTYLGSYYYRHRRFIEALAAWADAADVISNYNYSRDDEEIYKEFLEIANEIIPQMLRVDTDATLSTSTSAVLSLLRLYDGLCRWEQDSNTPVLHITWATHMLASLSKFQTSTRTAIKLVDAVEQEQKQSTQITTGRVRRRHSNHGQQQAVAIQNSPVDTKSTPVESSSAGTDVELSVCYSLPVQTVLSPVLVSTTPVARHTAGIETEAVLSVDTETSSECHHVPQSTTMSHSTTCSTTHGLSPTDRTTHGLSPTDGTTHGTTLGTTLGTRDGTSEFPVDAVVSSCCADSDTEPNATERNSEITALAHACCESLLNPDFLLGSGEPFVRLAENQLISVATNTQMDLNVFASCSDSSAADNTTSAAAAASYDVVATSEVTAPANVLLLYSAKMRAIKDLLVATKLNANAIKLQLTAQSQVDIKRAKRRSMPTIYATSCVLPSKFTRLS